MHIKIHILVCFKALHGLIKLNVKNYRKISETSKFYCLLYAKYAGGFGIKFSTIVRRFCSLSCCKISFNLFKRLINFAMFIQVLAYESRVKVFKCYRYI